MKVSAPSRPSFVLGSRPSTLYAPRTQPRPKGDITAAPPRIKAAPGTSSRNYGKPSAQTGPGFGLTGLTGES